MSKKSNVGSVGVLPSPDWGMAYVLDSRFPNTLNGNLFELIEILGLNTVQETALKNKVRSLVWRFIQDDAVVISSERHTEIKTKFWDCKKTNNLPVGGI